MSLPADAAAAAAVADAPAVGASSSSVSAASSSSAAAPASPAPAPAASVYVPVVEVVEVEADPAMVEQMLDQEQKAAEIAELRAQLKEHNEQFKHAILVRELESSDRVAWRFLRARKFDLPKTVDMFKEAVAMREQNQLDTILDRPSPKGLEYKVVSKHGWHGYDRFGRPVFVKNTGLQDFPALYSTGTLEERVAYNNYVNEWLRQRIIPDANARAGGKVLIDHVVTIVSLRNFGFHCIKAHNYSWVKEIAAVNNLIYPESAGTTVIINAPRVFSMVWGIIKGWLDERTREKVKILSGDGAAELKEALGEECYRGLPKEIGGECVCMSDSDVPKYGAACMLGHPMSVRFINHLKAKNDEAGIANSYTPVEASKLKDQEEVLDEAGAQKAVAGSAAASSKA